MRQKHLYSSLLLFQHFGCGMQLCSWHTMFLHRRVHLLARLSRKKKLGHVACVRNICMQMHFFVYGVLYVFLASAISALLIWKYQNFSVILYIKIWYFHTNNVEITHIGVEISFPFFFFFFFGVFFGFFLVICYFFGKNF